MTAVDPLAPFAAGGPLLGPEEAKTFLAMLGSTLELLCLYEVFFPEAFQQSLAQQETYLPSDERSYSECEASFFRLVDRDFFPLPVDDWLDGTKDLFGERRLAQGIPIEPQGYDPEFDLDWDVCPGWLLVLYLIGEADEEAVRDRQRFQGDLCGLVDLFDLEIEGDEVERSLLARRCEAQGGPLASFHLAVQMLRNETDSVYLNVTVEDFYPQVEWLEEEVEDLRRQYRLSSEISQRAEAFCEWLEGEPMKRFPMVVKLWNACVRDSRRPAKAPLLAGAPSRTR